MKVVELVPEGKPVTPFDELAVQAMLLGVVGVITILGLKPLHITESKIVLTEGTGNTVTVTGTTPPVQPPPPEVAGTTV